MEIESTIQKENALSYSVLTICCLLTSLGVIVPSAAQNLSLTEVTDSLLQEPPNESWLSWRGGVESWGYSGLDQINRSNVSDLRLVWSWAMDDTGAGQAAPLVHEGIMFLPNPRGVIQALNAATGDLIWEYRPGLTPIAEEANPITAEELGDTAMATSAYAGVGRGVQKNIAIYGDQIFAATENASIVALNAENGELRWETRVADPALGYHYTAGPIIADGVLVTGITGCTRYKEDICFITGHSPESGEEIWRTSTVARPGEPGGDTWGNLPLQFRAGGDAWVAGSYDPESNLIYWGTAQAKPWARVARGTDGDALFTNSTLALDPNTGEMKWYYQHLPGETHDMDEVFENVLIDIKGRKSLFKIGKLGILWQLDRISGEYINATDLGYQNIVSLNRNTGEVRYRDGMIPRIGEQLDMCPSTSGFKSWRAMSYDPTLSMLFIPITLNCELATFGPVERVLGGGGTGPVRRINTPHPDAGDALGEILAVSIPDGNVVWRYRSRPTVNTATLTTAGGLVFAGDFDRYFYALDSETGEKLWQTRANTSAQGFPISYAVDGKQYIALPAATSGASWASMLPRDLSPEIKRPRNGNSIYIFALPD